MLFTSCPPSTGSFHDAVKDAKRARAFHYCYQGLRRAFQKSPIQAIVTGILNTRFVPGLSCYVRRKRRKLRKPRRSN